MDIVITSIFVATFMLFLVFVPELFALINKWLDKIRENRQDKLIAIVAPNSLRYHQAIRLNAETKYHQEVFDDGKSCTVLQATSKANYDRMNPEDGIYEFLATKRE